MKILLNIFKLNSIRPQMDVYNNGGEWLSGVFITGTAMRYMTGFVHAEDHFWVFDRFTDGNGDAFKSIALGK